jgi:isopenicillin-N N-acyltransferase-like protein
VLELEPGLSPREQGRVHGETFAPLVREMVEIRTERTVVNGHFGSVEAVRQAAAKHLPVLERFSPTLHAELLGIAEGAGAEPADVVVLNHYTDLKDLAPEASGADDSCSAVFAPTARGTLLGQTWDMHGSAAPYVMMLGVPESEAGPACWLFSVTGCLGMAGVNASGLGVTINNLRSTDARIGVVWPALVRRVLMERQAEAGRDRVLEAPLGSGHHYLVASRRAAFGIETSGTHRKVVFEGGEPYVHTNHCVDDEVASCTVVGPESTTHERSERLTRGLEQGSIADRDDLWRRLGSHDGYPKSVCTHLAGPQRPHAMATCGAIAMDLDAADAWVARGCIHRALPHRFGFARRDGRAEPKVEP